MSTFAERIEEYQAKMGLKNTAELAREAGIPPSTLSEVKNGGHSLSAKNAEKLAAYVGVSIDEVYGIEKEKAPAEAEANRKKEQIWAMYSSLTESQQKAMDAVLASYLSKDK